MPFSKGHKINNGRTRSKKWKKDMSLKMKNIGHRPPSQLGKKRSVETRLRMSSSKSGSKSSLWRGGLTKINTLIRSSLEYRLWREAVFARDQYTCVFGGKDHGNKIQADHIKPFALFPELRFAIDNGRTLCEDCHKKTDTFGWNLIHKKRV